MGCLEQLFYNVETKNDTVCAALLEVDRCLNVNIQDSYGETVLHKAVVQAFDEKLARIVGLLLSRGANVHIKSNQGLTPLDHALQDRALYCLIFDYLWLNSSVSSHSIIENKDGFRNSCKPTFTIIEDISFGLERIPIPLKNYTNEIIKTLPKFYYTKQILTGPAISEIIQLEEPLDGCSCKDGCLANCPCLLKGDVRYSTVNSIDVDAIDDSEDQSILSECMDCCKCQNCYNKITQTDLQFRVEVCFVSQQLGFAVRTSDSIPKGSFITHYSGDLVDRQFAIRAEDDSYLFDIPSTTSEHLMIDSKMFGNFSRFFNHSCHPNLLVIEARSQSRCSLSKLAFVAKSDIDAGFQLSFDYGDVFWNVKSATIACKCGSSKCKYRDVSVSDD